jgi:lactoylglutathione lyase
MKLQYPITFVADMNAAVRFYRDTLGLPMRFQSPGWTEFETGTTTLALHPGSEMNRPGTVQLGFHVPNMRTFAEKLARDGLRFTREPAAEHGALLAEFADSLGTRYSVSAPLT